MKKTHSGLLLTCSTIVYTICGGMTIVSAMLLGKILDSATEGNMPELTQYIVYCGTLMAGYLVLSRIGIYFRMSYVEGKMVALKKESVKQILRMPISLYREKDQAYYANCLTEDANKISEQYYCSIPLVAYSICQFLCGVGAMIYVNYLLLFSYVIFFMATLLIPQLLTGNLKKKQEKRSESNEKYMANVKELTEGWETLKLNGSEKEYGEQLNVQIKSNEKIRRMVRGMEAFVNEVSGMCGSLSQLACIAFGGYLVIKGSISVGELVVAIQLVSSCFQSISDVSERLTQMNAVKPMIKKMTGMLPDDYVMAEGNDRGMGETAVSYEKVSFGFEQKTIIQDFDCKLEKGKIYAIVGESGKGKSTVMRLLLKYYPEFSGEIEYCGKSVRELSDEYLYSSIKYVSQDTYLFNDSIQNNITLHREVEEKAFQNVVERVNLSALLTEYEDRAVGDFGNRISGGERQRISLARALLQQPEMIIFDEPTSSLDPKNTKEILDTIFALENVTRIVITHIWDDELFGKFDGVIRL